MNIIFTKHALEQIERRGFLRGEVIDALNYPDITLKKHDKYYYQKRLERGYLEVVCQKIENNIKVITVYWLYNGNKL